MIVRHMLLSLKVTLVLLLLLSTFPTTPSLKPPTPQINHTTLICKHGVPSAKYNGSCICPKVFGGAECDVCLCKGGTCRKTTPPKESSSSYSQSPFLNPTPIPTFKCECPLNFDPNTNCVHCMKGFRGNNCALPCSNKLDCSGQGTCINLPNDNQVCDCDWPWTGSMCKECGCFNRGVCSNDSKLLLGMNIGGSKCVCRDHFLASTGCITCAAGYYVTRDKLKPFQDDTCNPCPGGASNPCNGRGTCGQSTGNCTCIEPYFGPSCERSPNDHSPSPSSGGGKTPLIPTHLAVGAAGLIAVASGACILGVAAVAFVSSLHRSNKKREKEIKDAREKRKKMREQYDSLSVFSAQFSPPAQRVDDDMMRHLLGNLRGYQSTGKTRANSNPEPLFLSPQQREQHQQQQGQKNSNQQDNYYSRSSPNRSVDSFPLTSTSSSPLNSNQNSISTPLLSNHDNDSTKYGSNSNNNNGVPIGDNRDSNDNNSGDQSSQRLSFVLNDHFKRPAPPLPGLNPNFVNNQYSRNSSNNSSSGSRDIQVRNRSDESFSSPTTAREWLVDVNNLIIHEQIGRGGSCLVYRATYGSANDQKIRVAVKSLALPSPQDFHSAEEYEYDLQDFRQEAKMLARLRHTYVVQFYGIAFTPKTLLLVEEYCPLSLHDLMARPLKDTRNVRANVLRQHVLDTGRDINQWDIGNFNLSNQNHVSDHHQQQQQFEENDDDDELSWWTTFVPVVVEQIARGMLFLHRSHTIHRDLKPENVLLNENGIFKICDFGVSRELHSNQNRHQDHNKKGGRNDIRRSPVHRLKTAALSITGQVGTPVFMAPEMFSERPTLLGPNVGYAIDVYSYGMLIWAIWSREQPYHRLLLSGEISNPYQIALRVTQHQLRPTLRFRDHINMMVPDMPHDIEVLTETCWNQTPSKRPSFEHILKILGSNTR